MLAEHWASIQLAEHWASIPKVVGSIPTVAGHIFQARPVWIYTKSNITNIMICSCRTKLFEIHGSRYLNIINVTTVYSLLSITPNFQPN